MKFQIDKSSIIQSTRELVEKWIQTSDLLELVNSFGGPEVSQMPLEEAVSELVKFSDKWDFRKGVERTFIPSTNFPKEQIELIEKAVVALGLKGSAPLLEKSYDAIVVLGGTLLACALRGKYAANLLTSGVGAEAIYFLGTGRIPAPSEFDVLAEFDLSVFGSPISEFDMLCHVVESEFNLRVFEDITTHVRDDGYQSYERKFIEPSQPISVSVLCTAGDQNPLRATTGDTYKHLLEVTKLPINAKILIVSTQIYVPFQHFDAVRLIHLTNGIKVETTGLTFTALDKSLPMHKSENYLQEIRSGILAASRLLEALASEDSFKGLR